MKYILKNGAEVESIPVGKTKIQIGEKRNRLTVCGRGTNGKGQKTRVICQCDCGNYTIINFQDFKNDKVKSCGCLYKDTSNKYSKDYSLAENNTNPFYEYLSPSQERWDWSHQIVWNIKCRNCGKVYLGIPTELISEKRTHGMNPCSCWKKYSVGVQKIINILNDNNIIFEQEKKYDTCVSPKGNALPFDFYIPSKNILIEYDGEQHFKIAFGQDEDKLTLQKEYDKIKNEWCIKNNITLIRIPYYKKFSNLEELLGGEENGAKKI